jgi:DNA-binding PadR family transcriptional regulator
MHTAYVSVRLGLLALLDGADMYGYQLKTAFEAHTGGVWPLNIGQVYTTLGRLERDGLVVASARNGGAKAGPADERPEERQHVYSITAAGRRVLADWYAASPVDGPPPRDDLITKVLLASVTGLDQALRVVTAQRTALFAVLQARRRALREAARPAPRDADEAVVTADARPATGRRWLPPSSRTPS